MSKSSALKNTTVSYEGDKIANMIYEHFVQLELMKQYKDSQISSVYVCRMTTSKTSTFNGIQALLSASDMLLHVILEGLYKSKSQDSVQVQTVLALYDQETARDNGRKVGECFQWKAHGQRSKGDSCSFSNDTKTFGHSGGDQRPKGRSSSPAPNSKAKQTEATRSKVLTREVRFHADSNSVKIRHVNSGVLPCV